jgi:methionyl-tRNA synthetase
MRTLGNLVSRVMKMSETNLPEPVNVSISSYPDDYKLYFGDFDLNMVGNIIWHYISEIDKQVQSSEPFKLIKTDPEKAKNIISELVTKLYVVAKMLEPLMPQTSEKILDLIKQNKSPETPLFLRKG